MESRKTSILLPSAYRANHLARCLDALTSTLDDNPIELLISCVEDDAQSIGVAQRYQPALLHVRTFAEYKRGFIWILNELARRSTGAVIAVMADDLICWDHWLTNCLALLDDRGGFVGFNDLYTDGNVYAAHFVVSRSFLRDVMGGVLFPPQYYCWWCDREISDKAQMAGRYVWAQNALVEHAHYSFGKAQIDRTYAEALPYHEQDRLLYQARKAANFPIDYEAVL